MERASHWFGRGLAPDSAIWRGVLRAYAVCCKLPAHKPELDEDAYEPPCGICGQPASLEWCPVADGALLASSGLIGVMDEAVSLLSASMCLEWFHKAAAPVVTKEDWQRVTELFKVIDGVPASTTATQLAKLLKPTIPGGDAERESLVETLGFSGLLVNPLVPGDMQEWTNWSQRPFGKGKNAEMYPPACGWRREIGVDADVFSALFPEARLPRTLAAASRARDNQAVNRRRR